MQQCSQIPAGVLMALLLLTSAAAVRIESDWESAAADQDAILPRVKRADGSRQRLYIVTMDYPPYAIKDGDNYTGFIPDIMEALSMEMDFDYGFHPPKDGKWGTKNNPSKKWNGMIGEVIDGTADMAAAALVITRPREQAVDFVMPFQHLGLTILIKKPHMDDGEWKWPFRFNIFSPLTPEVWVFVTIMSIIVATVLWLMNRFNPYDYGNRVERGLATREDAESFNISGALWFVFTTMQWQGYDRAPRSLASKTLGVFWFIFVTLTLITYTAGIVNHLFWASTVHGKDPTQAPIRNLEHLVMSDYSYGCVRGGNTYRYLTEVAEGDEFDVIRKYFQANGEKVLVDSTEEGVKRVRSDQYAFIMESMQALHEVNNPDGGKCDLMTVGQPFGLRSYGFALKQGSDLREPFHHAILDLQESGTLDYLERKWWVDAGKCWNVSRIEKMVSDVSLLNVNKPKRVDLSMFWGGLLLICLGIVFSLLVCVGEVLYFKYRGRYAADNRPRLQTLSEPDELEPRM